MLRLYEYSPSGNCYKIRLLLSHLGLPYERVELDIVKGETKTPEFLAMNPNARVPVLEIEPGCFLPESNAILYYLAKRHGLFPEDPLEGARTLEWMFFEQYSHEPYIATVRFWVSILKKGEEWREEIEKRRVQGVAALKVMEGHLEKNDCFVGGRFGIADICLYGYTCVAHEGGFDLAPFPAIRAWFKRVEDAPGYVGIGD